jgi:hypothetical protein
MANTNYFSGIVKILENPKQSIINNQTPVIQFRVEVPQKRKSSIVSLLIWGKLGSEVKKFYKVNDYVLIEGYTSLRPKLNQTSSLSISSNRPKQVFITVKQIYPTLLNRDRIDPNT